MGTKSLVSIIIPVYNVKQYLEKCVLSVLDQTYSAIEIILVDDGSTDGSEALCDELAASDERVSVFHKENGGLSDARNYGLERCRGEWVSFVDSDDFVSPIFVQALLQAALNNECDIAAIPIGLSFKDGVMCDLVTDICSVAPAKVFSSWDIQKFMLYQSLDTGAPWRIYRRELLEPGVFPVGLYYEDLASVYTIIRKVDKVAVVDCQALYAYRLRSNSIIRQKYRHIKAESALLVADRLYRDISAWYPELSDAAASRCFSLCRMVFAQIPIRTSATEETLRDQDDLWVVLRRYRTTVLRDRQARKRERLAAAIACFGKIPFRMFCWMCKQVGLMR